MNRKWAKKISMLAKQLTLLLYYSKKINFSEDIDKRKIIICFDGLFSHGGLVDRLKGIVSFYEAAKILDYDFYIHFNHPFHLSHLLKPNKVNWEIKEKELKYNPLTTKVLYLMDDFTVNPLDLLRNLKGQTFFVYSNVDYFKTMHKDNSEAENQKAWRSNYNELFTVTDQLNKEIQKIDSADSIVFHARFASLMGDFKDSSSIVIQENKKKELINKLIQKIQVTSMLHPNKKIYVLSDSIIFLNYIKQNTSFIVLEGSPKHIGIKNKHTDLDSHYKTFVDFYFMTKCDALYLLKFDQMYNSGFSKYAAIVGNKKFTILQE